MTWRDEFDAVGVRLEYGDVADVGRSRLNDYLKVDKDREAPRLHVHNRCPVTIKQLQRYVWDDWRGGGENRGLKQTPKDKEDDMPTLLKYLMNFEPSFQRLMGMGQIIRTRGKGQDKMPGPQIWGRAQ